MKLIIVESPSKAKTIKGFLKDGYIVVASKGHISDLDTWNTGVFYKDGNFTFNYKVTKDHKQIAKQIKDLASKAEVVYLATDEDREGEAIAYRIVLDILKGKPENYPRIAFHEITKSAILKALENPRKLDLLRVDAQVTRRAMDRVVGFRLSQLLARKMNGNLTAGRVQSCVVQMLLDREAEIENFKSTKYFSYYGDFTFTKDKESVTFKADLVSYKGKPVKDKEITIFTNPEEANEVLSRLKEMKDSYNILSEETSGNKYLKPKPPFMTSSLQQYASNKYGYTPTKTMQIAQRLYEGVEMPWGKQGAITYMRTDSLNIAHEAQVIANQFIQKTFGSEYAPKTFNNYVSGSKGAQEAHEAIRPTNIEFTPEVAKRFLEPDELKVYTAIYERYLASQSVPSEYNNTVIKVGNEEAIFSLSSKKTLFDGYYRVAPSLASEDKPLPKFEYQVGLKNNGCVINMQEKETQPPARYTEATLVKAMEKEGVGRPSTYASSIGLIVNRKYVDVIDKKLHLTQRGRDVCSGVSKIFPDILSRGFTSTVEESLDKIAVGEVKWKPYFEKFYLDFMGKIKDASGNMESGKTVTPLGRNCPECGNELVEREGRLGKFVGCSNFPKCKFIEKKKQEVVYVGECPCCNKPIKELKGRKGIFYSCSGYPACKFTTSIKPIPGSKCEKCGYPIGEGKKGPICTNKTCK